MAALPSTARIDRAHELRERILACAHARVAEGGFASLTMQALAEDAGIATGSLYRHFSGKGELAAEVFSNACRIEVEALAAVLRGPGSASHTRCPICRRPTPPGHPRCTSAHSSPTRRRAGAAVLHLMHVRARRFPDCRFAVNRSPDEAASRR